MVESQSPRLDTLFHALSDGTRRAMLGALAERPAAVGELAAPFDMSLAAVSKHLKVLERAGLVQRRVRGRIHLCSLDAEPLREGMAWMRHYEQFWTQRLDALESLLNHAGPPAPDAPGPTRSKP